MRVTREVQSLMRPADPAGTEVDLERAERELRRITAHPPLFTGVPRRTARRPRRLVITAPLLAAAVVAAVIVVGTDPDKTGPAPVVALHTGTTADAIGLLDRISYAAAEKPDLSVGDGKYVYVESKVAFMRTSGGPGTGSPWAWSMQQPHTRRVWLSVDGSRPGLLREDVPKSLWDKMLHGDGRHDLAPNPAPSVNAPTYRYLESLPTDPTALLQRIHAETGGMGTSPDQEAFTAIGDLASESLLPPKLAAALYRAAQQIPGVVLATDVADALGRHGVAVARLDPVTGSRTEWIFDETTLDFLGERSVQVNRTADSPEPGTLLATTAVQTRAVVDRAGTTPAAEAS
ncbi:CU044_5270 family protein [Kitasatospora sp. NPDC004614]|uniref:CU044_5270 family protein n=1 Tax=unclassified Kitasatospora TaxID=2633591 RepID=UPI0036970EB4